MNKNIYKLLAFLGFMVMLTPLGLLPEGDAWGEWSKESFNSMIGFIPQGLKKFSEIWSAPFPDYTISPMGDIFGYMLSAVIGILLIFTLLYIFGKVASKKH